MSEAVTARDVARAVIGDVAPTELAAFDYFWRKYESDPRALDPERAARPAHGVGASDLTLASLIVIPVVSSFIGESVKQGVQHIIAAIKERRARLRAAQERAAEPLDDTDEDERIATAIARELARRNGAPTP